MDFVTVFLYVLGAVFGSGVFSLLLSIPVLFVAEHLSVKTESIVFRFFYWAFILLLLIYLYHFAAFAYFYLYSPSVPGVEVDVDVFRGLISALVDAVSPTIILGQYVLLAYSVAFVVHGKVNKNPFVRTFLAIWSFFVVIALWFVVFPWSLERYLELFY